MIWLRAPRSDASAVQNGTSLTITFHQLTTTWSSPSGPGSLKLEMCGGTFGGSYQILVTLNPGLYPAGWLLGIDITIPELMSQFGHVPFRGPLGPSGSATIGPFTGLPHGLTIYSVFLDYPPGASLPATIVPAFAYTIP
jgi:hypothetical protein